MNTAKEMAQRPKQHFDDFVVGETLVSHFSFSQEEIIAFAERYDQQDMHTDPDKALSTRFGTLIGSGWQTATVAINALVQTHIGIPGGIVGMEAERLIWAAPTMPDAKLTNTVTVLEARRSKSIPNTGIVKFHYEVRDERGTMILDMITPTLVMIQE